MVARPIQDRRPGASSRISGSARTLASRDAARTLNAGDASLYSALYGSRFAVQSAETFAKAIGYPAAPIDDLLAFHVVFGKHRTRYFAQCRSPPRLRRRSVSEGGLSGRHADGSPLRGDRRQGKLERAERRRLGPKRRGFDQRGEPVVEYVRWVMVRKRDAGGRAAGRRLPICPPPSRPTTSAPRARRSTSPLYDFAASFAGSPHRFGDYARGERIDHIDGVTVEEAEHHDRDPSLSEHRQSAFQPVQRERKGRFDGG